MSRQRRLFTEEQMTALRQNPYVYSVTQGTLALTKEFKEIFYTEYQESILPRNILVPKWGLTPMSRLLCLA